MNIKLLNKTLSLGLALCFSATTFAVPVLAAPLNIGNPLPTHESSSRHSSSRAVRAGSARERVGAPLPAQQRVGGALPARERVNRANTTTRSTAAPRPHTANSTRAHRPSTVAPRPHTAGQPRVQRPSTTTPRGTVTPRRPSSVQRPGHNRPMPFPNRYDRRRPAPRPIYRPYPYWRRSGIVFHFGYPRPVFWWGCRRGISFGEYLIVSMIVSAARQATMDEIYNRRVNGETYESICRDYDVDWATINTNSRTRYSQMSAYATNRGIAFWGWNEILTY